jgi:hypothetical protein
VTGFWSNEMVQKSIALGLYNSQFRGILRREILRSRKDWNYKLKIAASWDPAVVTVKDISRLAKETLFPMPSKPTVDGWVKSYLPLVLSSITLVILLLNTVVGDKITVSIQANPYLNDRFSKIDDKFSKGEQGTKELTKEVTDLKIAVNSLKSEVERLKDPRVVFDALKKAAGKDDAALVAELPQLRQALGAMRDNKNVRIPERSYKETSALYIKRFSKASPPVKTEIFETLKEMAVTKSVTDGFSNPITEAELQKAKQHDNLFESGTVDLSQRKEWRGTIFKNCKITVSRPKQTLNLVRVRFVDVELDSMTRNEASENLVAALVSSDSPTISKTVINSYRVTVVPCCLKPEAPPSSDSISLLRRH